MLIEKLKGGIKMYEWLTSFAELNLSNPLLRTAVVSLARSVSGWLYHALEDGKIDMPEIKELAITFFRMIPQAVGLSAFGIPVEGALITDITFSRIKDIAEKK